MFGAQEILFLTKVQGIISKSSLTSFFGHKFIIYLNSLILSKYFEH